MANHKQQLQKPKIAIQKECNDCKEEMGLDFFIYQNRKYCKECYLNVRDVCYLCGKEEKSRKEFFPAWIEEDGIKRIVMCVQCSVKLQVCEKECGTYFKKSDDKKCDQCDSYYCKLHKIDHTCKVGEPMHLFRPVSNTHYNGSPNLAKEIKIPWLVGIELEAVNGDPDLLHSKLDRKVGISHDGSLQGKSPIEMQLPPSSNEKLEQTIRHATKIARNAGYKVNKSCGMHIHLDATNYAMNGGFIFRLLSTYYAIEPVIFAMLPKSRRNNKYALPLRDWVGEAKMLEMTRKPAPTIDALRTMWYKARDVAHAMQYRDNKYDSSRYHGFNIHCLFKIGTIEMRYHNGTLNRTKITNWINFHLMIFDWVLNRFNQNVVDAVFFTDNVDDKFRLMNRHFKFNKTIRKYVRRNIKKFQEVEEDND